MFATIIRLLARYTVENSFLDTFIVLFKVNTSNRINTNIF